MTYGCNRNCDVQLATLVVIDLIYSRETSKTNSLLQIIPAYRWLSLIPFFSLILQL